MGEKVRVLISKVGLDGHDRGAKVISQMLREAGFEVIYLGMYQMPENIVKAALEEDVDVVGLSVLSGEHLTLVPKVVDLLKKQKGMDDVLVIVGGVIPAEDIPVIKAKGVDEVFVGGSPIADMVAYINSRVFQSKAKEVKEEKL